MAAGRRRISERRRSRIRAHELASRAKGGEHLTIFGAGDRWLARDIFASLGPRAVLVETSRHVDSHLYALLAIGEQCGPDVGAKVAQQLRRSDLDVSLATVRDALSDRPLLLVESATRAPQLDRELRDVYRPQSEIVNGFLRERANVQAYRSKQDRSLRTRLGTPHDDSRWDSTSLWRRCRQDLELYLLAVSASILGYPLEDEVLEAGAEEVVSWMWELLAEPLRELLALLIIHGRPLSQDLISGCFVMGDYRAGVRASQDAYRAVPQPHARDAYLLERTVEHLMERQCPFAAVLAWGHRTPDVAPETFDQLMELTARGWSEQHVWSRATGNLWFKRPIAARIEEDRRRFRVILDGVEIVGDSVMEAVRVAVESLHRKVLASLMSESPGADEDLLDKLDAQRFSSGDEPERWIGYLAMLRRQALDNEISYAQRHAFLSLWQRVSAQISKLRRPGIGLGHGRELGLSWSFADIPGKIFTVEILPDGRVEWFFRDPSRGLVVGTEGDGEASVPDAALEYLREFGAAGHSTPAGG